MPEITFIIDGDTYDVDLLRSLARRDTPAALVAQAALDVGEIDGDVSTSSHTTPHSAAAGD